MPDLEITKYFNQLHEKCGQILIVSTQATNSTNVAESLQFATELRQWCKVPETLGTEPY